MDKPKQPSKEQVRQYMDRRVHEHKPPPSAKDIRRILGWHLK
jgi:hypothetical protein